MTTAEPEAAAHTVTTRLDPAVLRRAIRRFFWLRMRLYIAVTIALTFLAVALALAVDAERLLKLLTGFLLIAFPLVWAFNYYRYRRLAERAFAEFFGDQVTWRFGDEAMDWQGARMRGSLHWSLLKRLYLCPEFWVMHYRNNSFNVVPAAGIAAEVRDFVRAAALRHAAKVSENS